MVFFADDKLFKIIKTKRKNEYGQIVEINTLDPLPYIVNVQPIEEKNVKYTFGEGIESTLQAYVEKEMKFCIGDILLYENCTYEIEKKIAWKTYDIVAMKRVEIKWQ